MCIRDSGTIERNYSLVEFNSNDWVISKAFQFIPILIISPVWITNSRQQPAYLFRASLLSLLCRCCAFCCSRAPLHSLFDATRVFFSFQSGLFSSFILSRINRTQRRSIACRGYINAKCSWHNTNKRIRNNTLTVTKTALHKKHKVFHFTFIFQRSHGWISRCWSNRRSKVISLFSPKKQY